MNFSHNLSSTPDLNPVTWGHQCLLACVSACLLAVVWVSVWPDLQYMKKEPEKQASFFFTFLCLGSDLRPGHLFRVQPPALLRIPLPAEDNRRAGKKKAQEELGRQGRLSDRQAGCPTCSHNCERDRYGADVDGWRTSGRAPHQRTLSHCCYLHCLITITHLFTCPLVPARKMSCISI